VFCFRFQFLVGTAPCLFSCFCLSSFAWVQSLPSSPLSLSPHSISPQFSTTLHTPSLPPSLSHRFEYMTLSLFCPRISSSSFRVPGACCAAECLANSEGTPPLLPSLPPYRLEYITLSLFCPIIFPSSFRVPGACCAAACLANSGGTFISVDSKYDFKS